MSAAPPDPTPPGTPPSTTPPAQQLPATTGGLTPVIMSMLTSIAAVLIALAIGAIVILLAGDNPITAYRALIEGSMASRRGWSETLVAASPLILGGLAFSIAARAGLFNIGIEGQLMLGGLAAGLLGAMALGLPAILYVPVCLLAAGIVGGCWAGVAGVLKARTGASEVISTIMLNYLAYRICTWAVNADDKFDVDPGKQATLKSDPDSLLPRLFDVPYRAHSGFLIAIVASIVFWYLLFHTTLGYRIRTVGLSQGAAAYAGISWSKTVISSMFLSGFLAGLAGAGEALGLQDRFYNASSGLGFTAIAVGLVGRNNPLGVLLAGLLFGILKTGATQMQNTAGTSKELVQILQALVILAIAAIAAIERWNLTARVRQRFNRRGSGGGGDRASAIGIEPVVESGSGA